MSGGVRRAAAVSLLGMEGTVVLAEAAVANQLPGMQIIGLPDTAVAEAKQRVRVATQQAGVSLSDRLIVVNLSPAALPKQGSGFDLAIALAALSASGKCPDGRLSEVAHIGELGLDGGLSRPQGLLAAVLAAQRLGFARVMVPARCSVEAALVPGIEVIAAVDLRGAIAWHRGDPEGWWIAQAGLSSPSAAHSSSRIDQESPEPGSFPSETRSSATARHDAPECDPKRFGETDRSGGAHGGDEPPETSDDISEVIGHPEAIEALTIAAAGRHHVSMIGPPGSGKTMLATRLRTILPDLTDEESTAASSIASLGGTALETLIRRPPFESPHHTASAVSIIGGGDSRGVRPGAITRACHGLLFLDEAPEFPRAVLDALRQPLETGTIEIHRAAIRASLPARVQLVLASNPCPCGNAGTLDAAEPCRCAPSARLRYLGRISGPLQDRIDVKLAVHRVSSVLRSNLESRPPGSAELRERVTAARARARRRLLGTPWSVNAEVPGHYLRGESLRLPRGDTAVLDRALARGSLTVRGYDRSLRVAWSIADLEERERPGRAEIARALLLRDGAVAL